MKKTLRFLLAALLALSLLGTAAFAESDYTQGFYKYRVEDGGVTITLYFGSEETVTVPNQISGKPVSKIAAGAFMNCPAVKAVILPDTIMEIEAGAFGGGISVDYSHVFGMQQTDNEPEPDAPTETEPETTAESPAPEAQTGTREGVETGGTTEIAAGSESTQSPVSTVTPAAEPETAEQTEPASPTPAAAEPAAPAETAPPTEDETQNASSGGAAWWIAAAVLLCGAGGFALWKKKKRPAAGQ